MKSQKVVGSACLILAMALVGSSVVASKVVADGMHPLFAVPLRFAISTPIFVLLMLVNKVPRPQLSASDLRIIALQAGAGSAGYSILMIAALTMTTSANAGIISGLLPTISALVAVFVLREILTARLWLSIASVTAGAVLISFAPGESIGGYGYQLLGNFLVVIAVSGEALFSILNKRISTPIPPLYLATLMSAVSLALTIPLGLAALLFQPLEATAAAVAATAYIALFPTVVGFWLWYSGSSRMSGGEASVFMAMLPVTALILSALFLGEKIDHIHLLGLFLVVFGMINASWPWKKPAVAA